MIITKTLNFLLSRDPETAKLLCEHANKILKIELMPLSFILYFLVENNRIQILKTSSQTADTTLRGTPGDFLESLYSDRITVEISGDMEFARTIQAVIQQLDIDPEEMLSKIWGDSFAYGMGSILKKARNIRKNATARFGQNVKEYLEEEQRFIVSKAEMEDFSAEVDKIRDDVERLSQRIGMIDE